MNKPDPIPARLAALKTTSTPDLKKQWRDLFDSEPPPFNRRYLESRIAYRIQELAYGGLKPETIRRLERLADEYDAAQARGEVKRNGGDRSSVEDHNTASTADLGLRRDQIHEARQFRDAEAADPGIVRRTLDDRLERGEEPTRAALRKMVVDAAMRGLRPQRSASRRNPLYVPPTPEQAAWRHVTGTFRAFAEWASDENLALARKGMREARDTPFHDIDATAIAEGSAAFTTIKEWFDAR